MILDQLAVPIVLSPLAGGPSTPELAAAVSGAGGLGLLASGYLSADLLAGQLDRTRQLTDRPFGVNVFVPGRPTPPEQYRLYVAGLAEEARRAGVALGTPHFEDDDWSAKLALLGDRGIGVVSFTFGCPAAAVVAGLQQAGTEVWVTVTSVAEAALAVAAGADALVVQGAEAGGHRASFVDDPDADAVDGLSLLSLLQLVLPTVSVPVVASGGIGTGAALAAVLCAGAAAAQLGTAFLRAPEAGTSAVHRQAVEAETPTVMTRVFTGRLARGVKNRLIDEHAPGVAAYPEVHYATAALRRHGREFENPDVVNLWAGQTHALARDRPAAEIVGALDADCRRALADAAQRIGR